MDHRTPSPHSMVGDGNYFIPVPEYTSEYGQSSSFFSNLKKFQKGSAAEIVMLLKLSH